MSIGKEGVSERVEAAGEKREIVRDTELWKRTAGSRGEGGGGRRCFQMGVYTRCSDL